MDGSDPSEAVRTFLIADVRGYTRFTRQRGDASSTDWAGYVDLWNPRTGKRLGARIPVPGENVVASVAWSPDGRTLAATDWAQTLRLFDPATRQEVGPAFHLGHTPSSASVTPYAVFTPDSSKIVITEDTGRSWIFPATLPAWENRACSVANRNFTRTEWAKFVPGRPYQQVCAGAAG